MLVVSDGSYEKSEPSVEILSAYWVYLTSILMDDNGSIHSQYHDLAIHCHFGNRYCVLMGPSLDILAGPRLGRP